MKARQNYFFLEQPEGYVKGLGKSTSWMLS